MSNQLPVSPETGRPSPLTAMIRRSVGIPDGAPSPVQAQPQIDQDLIMRQKLAPGVYPIETPRLRQQVRRGMGLDQPQQQAQQQAQVQRAGVTAQDIAAAVDAAVEKRLAPMVQQLAQAVAQTNAQQQRQPMVQQAAYAPTPQRLPLPPTGPGTVSGGQTVVITHAPTNPGTAANAALCQMRSGPIPGAPAPMVQRSYADPNLPVSPDTGRPSQITAAVRRSMGLGW